MSGWERLAFVNTRTQTTNANDTLVTATFPARKFLHIESFYKYTSGGNDPRYTFNTDQGSTSYAWARNVDNATESNTGTGGAAGFVVNDIGSGNIIFDRIDITNVLNQEKQGIGRSHYAGDEAGSGNTDDSADPHWREYTAKWINTTEQITKVQIIMGSGAFESGACMTVWGSDAGSTSTFTYPNGTIFEESDTGKHYMFDGTDTWNEMT